MTRLPFRRRFVLLGLVLSVGLLGSAAFIWAAGGRSWALHLPLWTGLAGGGALALWGRKEMTALFAARSTAHGAVAGFSAAAVVGIAALLNGIAASRFDVHWDFTEDRLFSLSEQTHAVLDSLTEPARIIGFFDSNPESTMRYRDGLNAEHLLKLYKRAGGGKIEYKIVDPDLSPLLAQQYGVESHSVVVFESMGRTEKTTSLTEADFTSALLKLSRGETPAVYFLVNHGERSLSDPEPRGYYYAGEGLRLQNYRALPLNLRQTPVRVPADAAAVVIAGPREPFLASELNALDEYADQGGRLMVLMDPIQEGGPEQLRSWLKRRAGLSFENGYAVDLIDNNMGDPTAPFAQLKQHQITAQLLRSFGPVPFHFACPVVAEPGVDYHPLAHTASKMPGSWVEIDFAERMPTYEPEKGDKGGPVMLGAAVEIGGENGARVALFGDADFASNQQYRYGGGDLFNNAVNWLTRQESLIAIPPRDPAQRVLRPLTSTGARVAFVVIAVFLSPALFTAVGVGVWLWRR